ncbi:fimbrillin family protein [Bacteroides fragilis]|uniref:fimbrillin family protein n=1 Tax=Bacteroides fragilis TaxID=817 RepID=UPI0022AA6AEB|nr:fimbrillin family protein [Bacteroides fragilis]MCZ2505476.1 fimbrillin family protein [Bacteroides fragilis]
MMINQTKYHWLMALPALLLAVGCSESILPEGQDTGVAELQVSPQVVLTRGAIDAGSDASAERIGNALGSIAVYANSKTTNKTTNNYGLYTYNSSAWGSATDKIYLSAEEATIYAHYPAYQPGSNGEFQSGSTVLKATESSGEYTESSTINISVFPGSTGSVNAKIDFQSTDNSDSQTSTKDKILAASGEVDYMYADQGSTGVKASYKNGDTNKTGQVTLAMKHALAMVSFRVYADHTYKNTGAFSKLVLANKSGDTKNVLNNGGITPAMKIKDGTITLGSSPAAVTYTRDIANYTLSKATADTDQARATAKNNAMKASILVLPENTADKSTVEATLTIDNQDYKVALPDSNSAWEAGKNYLYTVKLSGSELVISSVTVTEWTTVASSTDLDIK